jgi:hypothetical protein
MRKQIHRLCVEISRDSHRNVDMPDERLQLFHLDFPGAVGGMAATANLRSPDSECQQGRASLASIPPNEMGDHPQGTFSCQVAVPGIYNWLERELPWLS